MAIIFNLDKLLASKKMQSVELAEKLGVTVQTVSRFKNGKVRAFRIETMNDICKIFDCQPGDVLEYIDDEVAKERFGAQFWEDYEKFFYE